MMIPSRITKSMKPNETGIRIIPTLFENIYQRLYTISKPDLFSFTN